MRYFFLLLTIFFALISGAAFIKYPDTCPRGCNFEFLMGYLSVSFFPFIIFFLITLGLFRKKKEVSSFQTNKAKPNPHQNIEISKSSPNKTEPLVNDENFDNEIYEKIADELENNVKQKGLWTRAVAEANVNENIDKSIYIKLRFKEIKDEAKREKERKENFDRIKNSK